MLKTRDKLLVISIISLMWIISQHLKKETTRTTKSSQNHPVCKENLSPSSSMGCLLPSLTEPYEPPSPWLPADIQPCPYLTEHYTRADCSISGEIQVLALDLLHPTDVVLEIGARYGTVSCAVALAQNNSGRLITVEADPDVWAIHNFITATTFTCF